MDNTKPTFDFAAPCGENPCQFPVCDCDPDEMFDAASNGAITEIDLEEAAHE